MNLAEFLLARIAEDEGWARAASPWATGSRDYEQPVDWRRHMWNWSPARVLAECGAKRRIVTEFGSTCSDYFPPGNEMRAERETTAVEMGWDFQPHYPEQYTPFCDGCAAAESADNDHARVLRLLALPFTDHPDYDPSWRP